MASTSEQKYTHTEMEVNRQRGALVMIRVLREKVWMYNKHFNTAFEISV
jgi:hypothetical protein